MPNFVNDYTSAPAAAFEGMLAETRGKNASTKKIETAKVGFGLAVGRGSADGSAKIGGTGFIGATLADRAQTTDGEYAIGVHAAILEKGVIWVKVGVAVTPADTPTFLITTGVWGKATTTGHTSVSRAKYLDTAAAETLVRLELT